MDVLRSFVISLQSLIELCCVLSPAVLRNLINVVVVVVVAVVVVAVVW